jgi:hypothetical protein
MRKNIAEEGEIVSEKIQKYHVVENACPTSMSQGCYTQINDSQLPFATGCKIDNRLKVHIECRFDFLFLTRSIRNGK